MPDYISDSDEDISIRIDSKVISRQLLEENILKLSPSKRIETRRRLFETLPYFNEETNNENEKETQSLTNDVIENSDESELDTLSLRNLSTLSEDKRVEEPLQDENETILQKYIDLRSSFSTRRSLRKRNFASTHPYLADQAHYLGLSNLNYLNEIYQDNDHEIEPIVKYLNYNYLKLKKSYPKDDKYKAKSFYTILGKQSQIAKEKEEAQGNEFQPDILTSQIDSDVEKQNSSNVEDDSDDDMFRSRYHPVIHLESDNESDHGSSTGDERKPQDVYVRVGGKIRKEKSALKGVLPESAKRLDIYKGGKKTSQRVTEPIDYRKGMAVRKILKRKNLNNQDFESFVDDTISVDANELYQELYNQHESPPPLSPTPSFSESILLSDRSSSEAEQSDDELDILKEVDLNQMENVNDYVDEVQESDQINHMFSTKPKIKRRKLNLKSKIPSHPKQNYRNHTRHTYNSSKSGDVYIKLPFKKITRNIATKEPSRQSTTKQAVKQAVKQAAKQVAKQVAKQATKKPVKKSVSVAYQRSIDNFLFSRTPVSSTTVFEAEFSENAVYNLPASISTSPLTSLRAQPSFDPGCMLNEIDLQNVKDMAQGKSFSIAKDSVSINFMSEIYFLTLVDIERSHTNCERLLSQLNKSIKNNTFSDPSNDLYDCLHKLILWYLILQKPPSQKEIILLQNIMNNTIHGSLPSNSILFLVPYLLLLQFTTSEIANLNSKDIKYDSNSSIFYWQLLFDTYTVETFDLINFNVSTGRPAESFFIMCSLSESNALTKALTNYEPINISIFLDCVMNLCFLGKVHSWGVLQMVYSKSNEYTDSEFYHRYIEAIHLLNRKGWLLDEKVILQIYYSITSRKFANFPDEGVPDLIGSDLKFPVDTFFDKFMNLLHLYAKGLDQMKTKKLVIKLFTSSNFQYQNDQDHMIMYINRLNLIILLSSLSTVDLKSQLTSLLSSMHDITFINLSLDALITLTNIAVVNNSKLPIEGISMLLRCLIENFFIMPGILKAWKKFITFLNSNHTQVLLLQLSDCLTAQVPEKICSGLVELFTKLCDNKAIPNKLIQGLNEANLKVLNREMSRLPLPSISDEARIAELIKSCISLWIKCTSLLNENWDRLVLQTFPYTGNYQSRNQFALYFYHEVSRYHDLRSCKEVIVKAVLKALVSFDPTPDYLWKLINKLKWSIFKTDTIQTRALLVRIIQNIAQEPNVKSYIKVILKDLFNEFNKYFSSSWYREFCTEVLKEIQKKIDAEYIDQELLINLSLKLGISRNELIRLKFHTLPLRERLTIFHAEFFNALYFSGDYVKVLEEFTFNEGTELIFQMIYIYLNEVEKDELKWRPISMILDFFIKNIEFGKFKLDIKFISFLKALEKVLNTHINCETDHYFNSKASVIKLLKHCLLLFDGYKDQHIIRDFSREHSYKPLDIHTDFRLNSISKSIYPKESRLTGHDHSGRDEFFQSFAYESTNKCLDYTYY